MSNITVLYPYADVPTALRNIAAACERGEFACDEATIIIATDVFHIGVVDNGEAACNAIFNMTFGIQKLMRPVVDMSLDTP